MRIVFSFLILALSLSASAEIFISCPQENSCVCPNPVELPVRTPMRDKDEEGPEFTAIFQCNNVVHSALASIDALLGKDVFCDSSTSQHRTLYDQVLTQFPEGCGYKWQGFSVGAMRETIQEFLRTGNVLCSERHQSMCTSATFLVFLDHLKKLRASGDITEGQYQEWINIRGPAWDYLNRARPDLLMESLRLRNGSPMGTSMTLSREEVGRNPEWPKEGDFLQFWRANESGHSVIFGGFQKNAQNENVGICYWSSNSGTNGYGRQCETLQNIDSMIIGRLGP